MTFRFILLIIATALGFFVGCNWRKPRTSQLDGVRRAELRIESRIATGINKIEYPQVLSGLAYELLAAKDLTLDLQDTEAVRLYAGVLEIYMAAKDVWEANEQFRDCLAKIRDAKLCKTLYGASVDRAALKAQIAPDVAAGTEAVQMVWKVAKQKSDAAESARLSRGPIEAR